MNILIIKPGAIGDLLQMTPVFRALKKKFNGCRITLMVGSDTTAAMFRHLWSVDETMVFERKGRHGPLSSFLALRREIGRRKFDLVLNFQRSNLKAWLLASAAFPCRVLIYHKAKKRSVHAVVNHLETLAPLGIDPLAADRRLELTPGADEERYAEKLLETSGFLGKKVIALNPGASFRVKCWPAQRFAALGNRLAAEMGAAMVIVGGPAERDLAEEIVAQMSVAPLDLVGKTDLLQLGAVLQRCELLVSGDTGPMHMATAVGTPVIALFGAIDPNRTGPVGEGHLVIRHPEVKCVPCNGKLCAIDTLECMEKISVDEVFTAVVAMLESGGKGS